MLKWVIERLDGTAAAIETPIGHVPTPDALDIDGLDLPDGALAAALAVDADEWRAELPLIEEWFDTVGDTVPSSLRDELALLEQRLEQRPAHNLTGACRLGRSPGERSLSRAGRPGPAASVGWAASLAESWAGSAGSTGMGQ